MRYSMIMAGGSGTRLWPMSQARQPKQLIPFIEGKSLLQLAWDRLEDLTPADHRYICAGQVHKDAILRTIADCDDDRYLGEPMGRDTLNAVGLGAAVIGRQDPDAVIAVFTADHIIKPLPRFRAVVDQAFQLAEMLPKGLITFGVTPTHAATGYGYLELGDPAPDAPPPVTAETSPPRFVSRFMEKPDLPTAEQYFEAGASQYLWNSGMFVWKASTLIECIRRYEPEVYDGLTKIAKEWDTPQRDAVMAEVYPKLKKISVDFAVMERASKDDDMIVAAVPMPLTWLDVGSWPAYASTLKADEHGNTANSDKAILLDTRGTLAASNDPDHLITTIGCDDLIIIHTPKATLVCPKDRAQDIKTLHAMVRDQMGEDYV